MQIYEALNEPNRRLSQHSLSRKKRHTFVDKLRGKTLNNDGYEVPMSPPPINKDSDGYEMPLRSPRTNTATDGYDKPLSPPVQSNNGSVGGGEGMARRNIKSLSINPPQEEYLPMRNPNRLNGTPGSPLASPNPPLSPSHYYNMTSRSATPIWTVRSPTKIRSISMSPTIQEEGSAFPFPPSEQEHRNPGHDSGVFASPTMVTNVHYFEYEPQSVCKNGVNKYRPRTQSETSSGFGSLSEPSRESIMLSPKIPEEELLLPKTGEIHV